MKNILFISHSNNDLDHFLPVIVRLQREKDLFVKLLWIHDGSEYYENKLHQQIIKDNNINIEYLHNNYFIKKYSKLRTLFTIYLFGIKKIRRYLKKNKINLIITDIRSIDMDYYFTSKWKQLNAIKKGEFNTIDLIIVKFLVEGNYLCIDTLSVPHGPEYECEQPFAYPRDPKKNFYHFTYSIHPNTLSFKKQIALSGLKDAVILGCPRYDSKWMEYIDKLSMKTYNLKKPEKKILLYIASYLQLKHYRQNITDEYHQQIHKDILSLVKYNKDIEIWMKLHPRKKHEINTEYLNTEEKKRIKLFYNIDTSALFNYADIIVSPGSSTLVIGVVKKIPIIFYDKWKEKTTPYVSTTFFDELPFILKASTPNELKLKLSEAFNYTQPKKAIERYYNKMFNTNPDNKMTERYYKFIRSILCNSTKI